MQGPQAAQGDAVQEVQGAQGSSGQASLRQETAGFRRSDQAHLQEEGQDHQEDCAAYGVHRVQIPQADSPEALQALRAGR